MGQMRYGAPTIAVIPAKKHATRKSPELIMAREGLSVTLKDGKIVC